MVHAQPEDMGVERALGGGKTVRLLHTSHLSQCACPNADSPTLQRLITFDPSWYTVCMGIGMASIFPNTESTADSTSQESASSF